MYLTFQQGTNEVENIKNIYSDAGLLIIDNINLLANKEKIKEIFFEIIHHVIQNNGKILASTSIDIAKTKFSERESGILLRGLQISIKQPTKEDIKKILLFNINREKINLSFTDEALDFIISRNKNINHLQGLVHKVLFYASNNNIKENIITSSDVKKALEIENNDEINAFGFDVDPVLIIKNICQAYNIAYEKIISKDKSKKYNSIRAICMYVLKNKYPNMTYNQVASYFSGRSHSTVFAAINKIDATIKNDETLKNFLKKYIKI
jgi:chromosomal replication initiator protein